MMLLRVIIKDNITRKTQNKVMKNHRIKSEGNIFLIGKKMRILIERRMQIIVQEKFPISKKRLINKINNIIIMLLPKRSMQIR